MKQIWAMAQTHMYISFRTPITVIMAFIMPVIFTAVLGVALAAPTDGNDQRVSVVVLDLDQSPTSQAVLNDISQSTMVKPFEATDSLPPPTDLDSALAAIDNYERVLVLPAGFGETLMAGDATTAQFYIFQNSTVNLTAQREVQASLDRVSNVVVIAHTATNQAAERTPFASETAAKDYFETSLGLAQDKMQAQRNVVVSEIAGADSNTLSADGVYQSSPGTLVMFGLITLLSSAILLVEERHNGTLRRLVASPIHKRTVIIGKALGPFIIGLIQMAVLIGVGQLVFNVPWGKSPAALAVMIVAFDLAVIGLGLLMATLVRTTDQAVGLMIGGAMVMSALGGAWWPMEIAPPFMQTIGRLFPAAWAMEGFQAIILRGAGLSEIMLPAGVLFGFAILYLSLGVWRFRYE